MDYEYNLIHMSNDLTVGDGLYSLILLRANSLSITLCGVRCWLDGKYLLCMSEDDVITFHGGHYEAENLRFLPYFYNVNLNHRIIGMPIYERMRAEYGYPDFHLFRRRDDQFIGVLPITNEEYDLLNLYFRRARQHIGDHPFDWMWSCRTRSDMISILSISETVYHSGEADGAHEVLRYIRENLGQNITVSSLCAQFHTNRTTLTRRIKELTGLSPMQYVSEERLNQSRADLLFTMLSLSELAEKYGFSDENYYIRSFKKRFGVTPLQYRLEGRAERIRNETKYHLKEKQTMTVAEFEAYLQKGLGRAMLLLREEPDKVLFWEPLSRHILNFNETANAHCYHHALGIYEVELINCFDDREKRAEEIANEIFSRAEGSLTFYRSFLRLLGYGDTLREYVCKHYQATYQALYDYQKEHTLPPYDRHIWNPYFSDAVAMTELYKNEPTVLVKIASDIADFYDLSEEPIVPNIISPVWPDHMGEAIMNEVYRNHRNGEKLEKYFKEKRESFEMSSAPAEFSQKRYVELSMASAEEIQKVAKLAIETNDENERYNALSFFSGTVIPDLPVFPLDPSPLISMAKERIDLLRQGNELGAWSNELHVMMEVLSRVTDSAVKAFAYELLDEKTLPPSLRAFGLCMLTAQGEPKDRDTIIAYLDEWDEILPTESMDFLCRLVESGHPNAPAERLRYYYENAGMSNGRKRVLQAMQLSHSLTNEIRQECLYDADPYIRSFIKNENT